MKKLTKYIILPAAAGFLFAGCISEYHPADVEEISGILVVEGFITNGESEFKLSRSVKLSESVYDAPVISDASVSVECDDGNIVEGYHTGKGTYLVQNGDLESGKKYRLSIGLEGKTYHSEFLEPLFSPAIEAITYEVKADGNLHIQVTSADNPDGSDYYNWRFEEIWEIKTTYMANATIEEGSMVIHDPYYIYYYCWKENRSSSLVLASSSKLAQNKIHKHTLLKTERSNDRYSVQYYIYVKQNSLRKESYDYFSNLQLNAESTGSIFGPVPSEMRGNITCSTDNSIPVIGYVEVSSTTTMEQFDSSSAFVNLYERPYMFCPEYTSAEARELELELEEDVFLFLYEPGDPPTMLYTFRNCMDCRTLGGKKEKPDFWPNDHI